MTYKALIFFKDVIAMYPVYFQFIFCSDFLATSSIKISKSFYGVVQKLQIYSPETLFQQCKISNIGCYFRKLRHGTFMIALKMHIFLGEIIVIL